MVNLRAQQQAGVRAQQQAGDWEEIICSDIPVGRCLFRYPASRCFHRARNDRGGDRCRCVAVVCVVSLVEFE